MVRPLSPDSARVASDLLDQHYGADYVAGTVNMVRTQQGQNTIPAYRHAYASWARTNHPADTRPYTSNDVRAFRSSRPVPFMSSALAGLAPRASSAADVRDLARNFTASQLNHALIQRHNPLDLSGLPLPSGDVVPDQASFPSQSSFYDGERISRLRFGSPRRFGRPTMLKQVVNATMRRCGTTVCIETRALLLTVPSHVR